jgi:gliding motility-associated-like protein
MAGAYVLSVTEFGCTSDTAEVVLVKVGQKPVDNFTVTPINLCTPQQSFNITNNSTDYVALQWDYGAGANPPTVVNANTVNVTYSTYGQKTITLTATGMTGCVTTLSHTFTAPQKPATPVITLNSKVCIGDTIRLSTTSTGDSYLRSGPNGFTSTLAAVKIPATAAATGTYTLVVTVGLCSSDAGSITLDQTQIIPIPVASFVANPVIPSSLSVPTAVAFTNTSTLADSYLWNFGDGSTSTAVNPTHTYNSKGDFTVTLTATSQGTCNNSVSKGKLILRYNVMIFIPNTFTPNGDGVNDVFNVKITSLKTYHISIFNRLGAKLFDGYDITNPWNGLYNGHPVPVGTYYYVIDAFSLNDTVIKESGYVTVLR